MRELNIEEMLLLFTMKHSLFNLLLVVGFTTTETAIIIPESWFVDGVTWWTNNKSDWTINRTVHQLEESETSWRVHDVHVVSGTAKDPFWKRNSISCTWSGLTGNILWIRIKWLSTGKGEIYGLTGMLETAVTNKWWVRSDLKRKKFIQNLTFTDVQHTFNIQSDVF